MLKLLPVKRLIRPVMITVKKNRHQRISNTWIFSTRSVKREHSEKNKQERRRTAYTFISSLGILGHQLLELPLGEADRRPDFSDLQMSRCGFMIAISQL